MDTQVDFTKTVGKCDKILWLDIDAVIMFSGHKIVQLLWGLGLGIFSNTSENEGWQGHTLEQGQRNGQGEFSFDSVSEAELER